jgi:hypothetical protein
MAAPRVTINENKLRKKMQQYERIVGKEVRQLVHNSARLCAIELARYTFPKGLGSDSKKTGEKKIAKNLRSIFTIVNTEWWKIVLNMGKNGKEVLVNTKSNVVWVRADQTTVADISAARAWHKSKRGSDGQAKPQRMLSRAVIRQSVYRKLVRETEKKVGLAKAGWGIAALACQADVRQPARGIPAWVRRNLTRAKGAIDDRKATGLGWRIKIKNQVIHARATLSGGNQAFAVNLARRKFFSMMNHAIRAVKAKEAGLR